MNTVLIVEDEKIIRQGIRTMMQRSGVTVNVIIECNNGQKALEILQEQKVDVMFTDICMPKMDGVELVRAIQSLEKKPITVVVSGYDDFSYAVEMMRMGVREYILKPVDQDKIKEVLEKLDEEIEHNNDKDSEIRDICCQQLRYLLLNNNITLKETEVVINQCEDTFFKGNYVVCCIPMRNKEFEKRNRYIYLFDNEMSEIFIVSEENKNYLLKNELKNCYVGISTLHQGVKELRIAYDEAWNARKLAFVKGEVKVEYQEDNLGNYNDDRVKKCEYLEDTDLNGMKQMGQMIGTDKINDALKILERLKKDIHRGKYTVDSFGESINLLLDSIVITYQNILPLNEEKLGKLRNMLSYPCIDDYYLALKEWMILANQKISIQFDDYKNKYKIQVALEYIGENYSKDLNMAVVSNYISMNYSLFSYVFKQYTGNNFVNHLKDLRINKAKGLLSETNMRVNEISQKVGYNNEKHFMKIFKNICGVSPTEYRKNMQFYK
jgi:two-component system, response regulator YesN